MEKLQNLTDWEPVDIFQFFPPTDTLTTAATTISPTTTAANSTATAASTVVQKTMATS